MVYGSHVFRSSSDAVARHRAGRRVLEVPVVDAKIRRERTRLERDTGKWLRQIFPGIYRQPFGRVHHEIIDAGEYTIKHGGRCVIAAPRGTGKSYVVYGLGIKALVQEQARFPVVIPWDVKGLKKALGFWVKALCFNTEFARLYPDWTYPFVACRGSAQKCLTYTDGEGNPIGARLLVSEGMIVLPRSKAVIGGATINGNPLGLHYTTDQGEGLRPDLIFIDDPQDRDTAMSPTQILSTIQLIDYDIAGMAGPDVAMPMLIACTVKQRQDVAEHYLDDGEWRSVRVGQILKWPTNADLWDRWNEARLAGEAHRDASKAARSFYKAHKAELVDGMEVSWAHRYVSRSTKDQPRQPDAFYSAMWDYYVMGRSAFMAERQNEPVKVGVTIYNLTPTIVQSRVVDRAAGVAPEWAHTIIATTDVNRSYALTSVVVAFGEHQMAAVLWYGTQKMSVKNEVTEIEKRRIIYEELSIHGRRLAALPCRPNHWFIDGGGSPEGTVIQFAYNVPMICGLQASCTFGRGWKTYRPTSRATHKVQIGEQLHRVIERRDRQWVVYNADYWREIAQRGWTGEPGSPGSCSLPAGNHGEFAEQVCRETLRGKDEIGGRTVWVFDRAPGANDYGDCMHMAYMGAAVSGIGTGAIPVRQQRAANVVIRRPSGR